MLKLYVRIKDTIKNIHSREEGQDAFEYLLASGVIMVAVVGAVALGGPGAVTAVWTAVSGAIVAAA